jgi:CheY-like chemotaxis protein/two-component sensor histidine kinase
MLGHELRNPLSAVRNAVVAARFDPVRRERALDIACRGVDQLARLVDDLLDVARISHGKITLRRQTLDVVGVAERALEATRPLIEERSHELEVSLPASGLYVDGDAARLEQVVSNLLSNAAKYTNPGGHIAVEAGLENGEVVLRVRDGGIGISREMQTRVFDLFAQADRALDRAQGGLGIGLTVVRRLVELHAGRVEVHSDGPDTGSEFVVRLPVSVGPRSGSEVRVEPSESVGASVLVVEDNDDVAESLSMLLEQAGHWVTVVANGERALEAIRALRPDVVLADVGLPGMDGYEFARRVRAAADLAVVPLVALTGYGRGEDRERAIEAGFDHHLVKPVELTPLLG